MPGRSNSKLSCHDGVIVLFTTAVCASQLSSQRESRWRPTEKPDGESRWRAQQAARGPSAEACEHKQPCARNEEQASTRLRMEAGAGGGCLEAGGDVVVQVQLDVRIGHLAACAAPTAQPVSVKSDWQS